MNRLLIALGAGLVLVGVAWPWLRHLHLFRLPGDIVLERPGFRLYLPITTMLLISGVLSLLAWLLRK
jgi:Protein of unknown function (DUF2905)